jgi:hypothetical protein|tara:strand:- start:376 stop:621 length:246 start_codon:yes stop_codon:yes gene_type:complete
MQDNNINELIALNRRLIEETLEVKRELIRIRSKLETNLYKIATKYNVINNELLVVKNCYRGSIKCYKPNDSNDIDGFIEFK